MNKENVGNFLDRLLDFGQRKRKKADKYTSFNRRMLAVTIDSVILMVFLPLINTLAPLKTDALQEYTIDPNDPQASQHLMLHMLHSQSFMESWFTNFFMQMLFWCVFSAICLHFWSATPGKMLLRMKVVDSRTEGRINDLQVFLRSFGYLISAAFFCIGFIWIAFNKKHRGWHDYLAETVVINLPMPWQKKKDEDSVSDNTAQPEPPAETQAETLAPVPTETQVEVNVEVKVKTREEKP
jgi:uncharacterized RDD family membrane protein YckC